jgi:hypothetical protein
MKTAAIITKEGNENQAAGDEKRTLTVMIFRTNVFLYIPLLMMIVIWEILGGGGTLVYDDALIDRDGLQWRVASNLLFSLFFSRCS